MNKTIVALFVFPWMNAHKKCFFIAESDYKVLQTSEPPLLCVLK